LDLFDETVKTAVRQIVHSFYHKNEMPTLSKVMAVIDERDDPPHISRTTLHRLLKKLNFK